MKAFLFTLLILPQIIFAQAYEIKGKVLDSENDSTLAYTSILLAGTHQGTVTNRDGIFKIKLLQGDNTLITRYVGYKTDTLRIKIPSKAQIIIKLIKRPVLLADVVVTDEDPAYRIIREAIKRKRINIKGLKNFEYNAYSKKILKSSDEIALIEESFIKGYSKIPEWEKEFILKTHKSENQKKNAGSMDVSVSDKYLIDFSKDTLSLMMNQVYLPLADNAFDYYDYKLISTIETDNAPTYSIQVIPKSKIQPLLEGTIQIEGENYSICNVDLQANKGIRFPYVHDLILEFNQSLGKYDGYWLPDYVEMQVSLSLNLSGLIGIDKISYHMTNIISNYKINQPIPDSIENARHSKYGGFTADTSKNYKPPLELADSEISSLRPIPLTNSED